MSSQNPAPLRDVAQNPDAYARYLADIQRVLLDIGKNLETLQHETRVHCRGVHVEGDRWYHARLRALPVEKALKDVLRHVKALTDGLEKSAYKRRAHDDAVRELPGQRHQKALAKAQKKGAVALQAAPEPEAAQAAPTAGPSSVYDLRKEWSA